ncbi:hypothetical protein GKZ90_0021005 [Flavobacterium sp. MC2016-06]|uniref:hypothetical protein n=1 Tax=Flavobacterium sp. MC2016-06 TaxID=2676308 RepID=UPI0012BAC702|nr:hypothetical protein [Flavobacterium sp. MC2016-06]MBU3860980.1 hypothetical protein [Flavobacterium sp. MC2016-06]
MIKGNPVHDTIVIVKKDTIVKVVELVSKVPETKPSAFIQWFNDYSNVSAFFGTVATTGALIVAIIAIFKTAKDSRHQLLIGKFEEMYSLIYNLLPEYQLFFQLDQLMASSNDQSYTVTERQALLSKYKAELVGLHRITNVEEVLQKIGKLKVFANAYLDKDLKNETLSYCMLFEYIVLVTTQNDSALKQKYFENGFPSVDNVKTLGSKLSDQLIEKINLGGKVTNRKKFNEYFKGTFQETIELKN